jgi:hypothetical protein
MDKEMNSFERATIRWARLAAIMAGVAAIFVCAQWYEMHTSGTDTHDLAVAAGKQADSAKIQSENTSKLADAAVKQANASTAQVGKLQAGVDETARLAAAAASANKIAQQAIETQTRPWIGIDGEYYKPYPIATFNLVITNYGPSPAILAGEPIGRVRHSNKAELRYWREFFKEDICGQYERFPLGRPTELPRIRIPVFQGKDIKRPISSYLGGQQTDPITDLWVCVPYGGSDGIPKYQISMLYLVDFTAKTVALMDSDFGNAEEEK